MPERIVMLGVDLYNQLPDEDQEQFGLFDRYKDTWVAEQCDALGVDTDDFRDDLFRSLEDFMGFWGSEYLDECVGSVYARRYKDFKDEDEKCYQQLVEKAVEPAKSQIKILKPSSPEARMVKMRMKTEWQEIKKRGAN